MTTEQELDVLRASLPKDSPSISEMNDLASEIAALRDREKELADAKKLITENLEAKESRVTELMIENQLTSYKAPAGLLSVGFRTSVRQPQGEDQGKFYAYLKEKGLFDSMISVNSMKLNSFYKEEFELAKERGEDDFSIPGLTEVKLNPTLSFRRTR
jgi:hypothetical protein